MTRITYDRPPTGATLIPNEDIAFGPYARLTDMQVDRILEGTMAAATLKIRAVTKRSHGRCSICGRRGHNRMGCRG